MKLYHVDVTQDDGWFVGRVLEREGITTQGKTLDELVFMVRDAIALMWDETGVHLELIIPNQASMATTRKRGSVKGGVARSIGPQPKAAIVSAK